MFLLSLAQSDGAWMAEVSFAMGAGKLNCSVTSLRVDGFKFRVVTFDLLGTKLESTLEGERSGAKFSGKYRTRSRSRFGGISPGLLPNAVSYT